MIDYQRVIICLMIWFFENFHLWKSGGSFERRRFAPGVPRKNRGTVGQVGQNTKPFVFNKTVVPSCPKLGQVGTNSDNFGAKAAAGTVCHLANYALSRLIFGSGSN